MGRTGSASEGGSGGSEEVPVDPGAKLGLLALVGESAAMCRLREEIVAAAPARSTVLLCGETGTGKGLAARVIHGLSTGRSGPFVHVDCAALSPTLVESELFGHERGAFTGALARRSGRFERASGGTIFLDEIGDLALGLQAKLLRVLQDRSFERIGGHRTLCMTARVVAATNRDLLSAVREGHFRADLFYRLDVLRLQVPPLREREGDVRQLTLEGLERIDVGLGRPPPVLDGQAIQRLERYSWPGNVRQLMNVLERLAVHHGGRRVRAELLDPMLGGGLTLPRSATVRACSGRTREEIAAALAASGGNVAQAARRLGLPRSTLRYRRTVLDL